MNILGSATGITHRTVKCHIAAILGKLGAADRMGAIVKSSEPSFLRPSGR
jgi:DNA-binding NarL/FixJ family response regulator